MQKLQTHGALAITIWTKGWVHANRRSLPRPLPGRGLLLPPLLTVLLPLPGQPPQPWQSAHTPHTASLPPTLPCLSAFLPCPPLVPACSNTALTSYAGGIYTPIYSGTNLVTNGNLEDHAVTLVGYGYDTTARKHYWLIKNRCGLLAPRRRPP